MYYALRPTDATEVPMPRRPGSEIQPNDPGLLILASLADGPKHGYAMVEDIVRLAGVRLGPGTLYGALSRLESRGLIEALAGDDRRRPYQLTGLGRGVLSERLVSARRLAEAGLRRLATS
jgi:DNA-binding PadR family transcriptional regulator